MEATSVTATPATVSVNPALQADQDEVCELAKGEMVNRTTVNLKIAAILVRSIGREILNAAKSVDDISDFREQTIGLFSGPLSKATGEATTAKKLTEYVRIHYMQSLLPTDAADVFDRINWESLRRFAEVGSK